MAKRFLAAFLMLGLLVGTVGLVGCGEGDKQGVPDEVARMKAEKEAKAATQKAGEAATTTAPK